VEVLETLVDQSYVDDMALEHGESSPTYISRVTGEFAWDMGFTLIHPEDMAKGYDCDIVPPLDAQKVLGVDVSRSKAGDKNTVYSFIAGQLRFVDEWNSPDAMITARKVDTLARSLGVTEVRIDGVGLGGPIADAIRELSEDVYETIEILGGDPSPDKKRWFNFRAWMYWSFQDRLTRSEIDVDQEDDKLSEQLLGLELKKRTAGLDSILLESKEDMRKRGVSSPDHADAAMYASVDLSPWTGNYLNDYEVGDKVLLDPTDMLLANSDDHWYTDNGRSF